MAATPTPPLPKATGARALFDGRTAMGWNNEADPTSLAVIEVVGRLDGC